MKFVLLPDILIFFIKSELGRIFLMRVDLKLQCAWEPHGAHVGETRAALPTRTESYPGGSGLAISTNCPLKLGNYCFKSSKSTSSFLELALCFKAGLLFLFILPFFFLSLLFQQGHSWKHYLRWLSTSCNMLILLRDFLDVFNTPCPLGAQ